MGAIRRRCDRQQARFTGDYRGGVLVATAAKQGAKDLARGVVRSKEVEHRALQPGNHAFRKLAVSSEQR